MAELSDDRHPSDRERRAAASPQQVHGSVQVDLGGGASGRVGVQREALGRVMALAAKIWAEVRRSGVAPDDDAGNDALLAELRTAYKDFAVSYPVPFRWMVQAREYEPRAFESYLREHVKPMYADRKEFLAAQGAYLVQLYRARHPRAGSRQLGRYREAVEKSLAQDDEAFAAAHAEAEEEVRRMDAENDAERRQRLWAHLRRLKAERVEGKGKGKAEAEAKAEAR